jgi:hypothetical protein
MPISQNFLANIMANAGIPSAQRGVLPGYTGGSLQGYGTFNAGAPGNVAPPPAPIVPEAPPPMAAIAPQPAAPPPPEQQPQVGVAAPELVPAPTPQLAPQPKLIAMQHAGTAAHEINTVGEKAQALTGDALMQRNQAVESGRAQQSQAYNETINAAQKEYDRQQGIQAGAQAAQANEQAELLQKRNSIDAAVQQRTVTPITSYWADKSTAAKIGMTLSAALGSFGAAFARNGNGQNPALAALQSDIQSDLNTKEMRFRQQQGEANAKVDSAQAAFNNAAKQFGIHGAREIENAASQQMIANQAKVLAAKTGLADMNTKADQVIGELYARADESKASALKLIQKTGPTTGYIDPNIGIEMNRKEALNWRQKDIESTKAQEGKLELQGVENEGKLAASRATTRVDATTKGTQYIATNLEKSGIPEARANLNTALSLSAAARGVGDSAPSRLIWNASPWLYGKTFSDEAAAREQAFQSLANVKIKNEAGGSVTQGEWDRQVKALYGGGTEKARQQAIESLNRILDAQEENTFAGAGPEATAAYKTNREALKMPRVDFKPNK